MKYLRVRPATRFGGFELEKDTSLYLPLSLEKTWIRRSRGGNGGFVGVD